MQFKIFRNFRDQSEFRKFSQAWFLWVLLAAGIAPFIGALKSAFFSFWVAIDDFAIIDMRIRDVWSASVPLTGLYSRPGWNHPGPMMFWVLTPFSLLSGGSSRWVLIGGVLIAASFIATALYLAFRQSRTLFVMTSLLWLLSLSALPIGAIVTYWNPWMPLPALILLVVLALRTSAGKTRDLIGLVVVGSFAVQTHIGTALIVVAIGVFAFGCVALDAFRERVLPHRFKSTAIWVVGLSAFLWAAPFIGVLMRVPGNLGVVGKYFIAGGHQTVGLSSALKIMANQFTPPFPWLGSGYKTEFLSSYALLSPVVWLLLPIGTLCLGGLLAYRQVPSRSGRRNDLRAIVLAVLLLFASIIAISGADEPRAYTFAWRAIVAVFVVLACAMPIARLAQTLNFLRVARGLAAGSVLIAFVLLSFSLTSKALEYEPRTALGPHLYVALEDFGQSFNWGTLNDRESIQVTQAEGSQDSPGLAAGIVNALALHQRSVGVPAGAARVWGDKWVRPARDVNEVWIVTERGSLTAGLLLLPNAELVWRTTPLSRREESRISVLQAKILSGLALAGKPGLSKWVDSYLVDWVLKDAPYISPAELQELKNLNVKVSKDCRCGIVKIPGGKGYLSGG